MEPSATATLRSLAADLAAGRTTSRALVEQCLARIEDPAGEGSRTFISVDRQRALDAATAIDLLRRRGSEPSPVAGIPIAIKDMFDVAGEITTAGSRVLSDVPAAQVDAVSVARLRQAGFILLGRANMTEFAYSGLGLNPHYGTPRSVFDRATGRAPGGSTSGGAVAVADEMAHVALGTDTGGSCRIPAAFNRLVGWKPTAARVSRDRLVPLSPSLDSIGSIGRSVSCCAIVDAVVAGERWSVGDATATRSAPLRLLLPTTVALDDLDDHVAAVFEATVARLARADVQIERRTIAEFADVQGMSRLGGFTAAESYHWHRRWLDTHGDLYDPRVINRIRRGSEQSACDYLDLVAARRAFIERVSAQLSEFDALVMPTVAIVPPRLADLESDAGYTRTNMLALRNTTLINMMDGCAITLPVGGEDAAPVGLMLAAAAGADSRLLAIAAEIERRLDPCRVR